MTPDDDKNPPKPQTEEEFPDTLMEDIMTIILVAAFSGMLIAILLT